MRNLYSEDNYQVIHAQLKKRLFVMLAFSLVFAGLFIFTLVLDNHKENRPEVWSTLILLIWGFFLIFFWDLLCKPLRSYEKFIESALHGRYREALVEFSRKNEEKSVVDGVTYLDLVFLGEADKHGDRDRTFYWDAELPDPPFTPGEQVTLRYHDRFITGYTEK